MSKLIVKQAFGLSPNSKNCVTYIDDHLLAYSCGHLICIINTDTKEQTFITLGGPTYKSNGISCIFPCFYKKLFAVSEQTDNVGVITFFDSHTFKKRKTLHHNDLGSNEFISISFSEDGKLCLTQGGGPEWNLLLWNVEKSPKVIASTKTTSSDEYPVTQVSLCPWDSSTILVVGKNVMKIFKFVEGQLRFQPVNLRRDFINVTAHCWLPTDRLIISTEFGEILLFENLEYRSVIYPTSNEDKLKPISCIISTNRGFLTGGRDGEIQLFERKDEMKEFYLKDDTYCIPNIKSTIIVMTIGSDDTLVCATDSQQLLYISLSNLYNINNNSTTNDMKSSNNSKNQSFEYLLTPFHGPNISGEAAIVSIDVALWRPLVATCGKDNSVRLWNPVDKRMELVKYYEEEPTSISIHPCGLHLAIAFNDKVKLVSILSDDLVSYSEITVRSCNYTKFSNGGQYIAIIAGPIIQIHDVYTATLLLTLRGHTNKIRSILWLNHDTKMMSVGADGVTFFWSLFIIPPKKPEQLNSSIPFLCGTSLLDGSKAYVMTNEKILREVSYTKTIDPITGLEGKIQEPKDITMNYFITNMIINETKKLLILGSSDHDMPGTILTMNLSPSLQSNYEATPLHTGPITSMCLSHDGNSLYTGDQYGCIFITEFESTSTNLPTHSHNASTTTNKENLLLLEFNDEILIKKSYLVNKKNLIVELNNKIKELILNNEYQLRLKDIEFNDKLKELNNKFTNQFSSENERYVNLLNDKNSLDNSMKNQINQTKLKYKNDLIELEKKYKAKIDIETNRHKNLLIEYEEMHKRWNNENVALVESHQLYLKELTEEYEEKLKEEQKIQRKLLEEKELLQVNNEETRNLIEDDADSEINQLRVKYENRLKQEEESSIDLKSQHTVLQKNLQLLTKDSDYQKEQIKKLKDKENHLQENIKSLEKDIQSHKKEIREREDTITDKEKRIFDLKKKNQELEKFRFVLDYKIKELKLQIAPRENEIVTMQKQIEGMNIELEQYHKSNIELKLMIDDLKLKLDGLRNEYNLQDERIESNINLLNKIKNDLSSININDITKVKKQMIAMYQYYIEEKASSKEELHGTKPQSISSKSNSSKKLSKKDKSNISDPQETYNRDREQMERSLNALRRAIRTETIARKRDSNKMMKDNLVLINELNELIKEGQSLSLQRKAIDDIGPLNNKVNYNKVIQLLDILGISIKKNESTKSNNNSNNNIIMNNFHNINHDNMILDPITKTYRPISSQRDVYMNNNISLSSTSNHITSSKNRTSALHTIAADGHSYSLTMNDISKTNHYEIWKEIQNQNILINSLYKQLNDVCNEVSANFNQVSQSVDEKLQLQLP